MTIVGAITSVIVTIFDVMYAPSFAPLLPTILTYSPALTFSAAAASEAVDQDVGTDE